MKICSLTIFLDSESVRVFLRPGLRLTRQTLDRGSYVYRVKGDMLDMSVHSHAVPNLVKEEEEGVFWVSSGYIPYGPDSKDKPPIIAEDWKEKDPQYVHDVLVYISIKDLPVTPKVSSSQNRDPIWKWEEKLGSIKSLFLQQTWRMRPGEILTIKSGPVTWRVSNHQGNISVQDGKDWHILMSSFEDDVPRADIDTPPAVEKPSVDSADNLPQTQKGKIPYHAKQLLWWKLQAIRILQFLQRLMSI
jgi:hypothetical protein